MAGDQTTEVVSVRYLACLDHQPRADGSCQRQAWVEQPSWKQYLPTTEQAVEIGGVFFVSLFTLAAAKRLLKPPSHI